MDTTGTDSVELLQRLIRFNTVNPPGDERPAQELLAGVLSSAGFDCELLGRTPERPNLVARLDGDAEGPTLCCSHTSTPCSRQRASGRMTLGRARLPTALYGGVARST